MENGMWKVEDGNISEVIRNAPMMLTEGEKEEREHLVSMATPYPAEVCVLEQGGVPFLAKGDIHAIKAKQKQGKTHAIAILAAAALGGTSFPMRWTDMVQRAAAEKGRQGPMVMYIDTEQKPADTQLIYKHILELVGLPVKDDYERLRCYTLRGLKAAVQRRLVWSLVRQYKPDLCFIDGVVDLCPKFNDEEASQAFLTDLMDLSTEADSAIVGVLHTNKDRDDDNMRGHLGTMLAQKGGTIIDCKKKEDVVEVTSVARHQNPPSWSYTWKNGQVVDAGRVLSGVGGTGISEAERRWQSVRQIVATEMVTYRELRERLGVLWNWPEKSVVGSLNALKAHGKISWQSDDDYVIALR